MFPGQHYHSRGHIIRGNLLFALGVLLSALFVGCGTDTLASSPTPTSPIVLQPTATATDTPTPTPLPTCPTPPASSQTTPITPKGWATFTDTVYHYMIQYPANWIVPYGSCSGMPLDVYNYDPRQVGSTPPSGGLKIEVLPMDNPSQLSASDFYNQLKQQPGFTPCPAAAIRSMTVGGHNALEVSCPAQNSDAFYVPDGQTMLSVSESISLNGKPSDVLTHMVASLQFTSQAVNRERELVLRRVDACRFVKWQASATR